MKLSYNPLTHDVASAVQQSVASIHFVKSSPGSTMVRQFLGADTCINRWLISSSCTPSGPGREP